MTENFADYLTFSIAEIDSSGNILFKNSRFKANFGEVSNIFEIMNENIKNIVIDAMKHRYPLTFFGRRHRKIVLSSQEYYTVIFSPAQKGHYIVELQKRNLENIKDELVGEGQRKSNIVRKVEIEFLTILNRFLITRADSFEFIWETGKKLLEYRILSGLRLYAEGEHTDIGHLKEPVVKNIIEGNSESIVLEYSLNEESEISFKLLVDFWIRLIRLYAGIYRPLKHVKGNMAMGPATKREEFIKELSLRMHELVEESAGVVAKTRRELFKNYESNEMKEQLDVIQKKLTTLWDILVVFDEALSSPMQDSEIDLLNLIKSTVKIFRSKLPPSIKIELLPDDWNPHPIKGDKVKLEILFSSLLDRVLENLKEKEKPSGLISFSLSSGEKEYLVIIRDNGKKMDSSKIKDMLNIPESLEKGYQVLILQSILFQQGIELSVETTEKGNSFILVFPRIRDSLK